MFKALILGLFREFIYSTGWIKHKGSMDETMIHLRECCKIIRDMFRIMKDPYIMPTEEVYDIFAIQPDNSGLELPILVSTLRNHHQLVRVSGNWITCHLDPNDDYVRIPLDNPDNWSIDTGFKPGSDHYFNIENYNMSEYVDFVKRNMSALRKICDENTYINDPTVGVTDMIRQFIKKEIKL